MAKKPTIYGPNGKPWRQPDTDLRGEAQELAGGARAVSDHLEVETLTQDKLASLLRDADSGEIVRQSRLFEVMERKDGLINTHMHTRKSAVKKLGWSIEPGEDSTPAKEAAEYVRGVIDDIPGLSQSLMDLLDATGKGFAVLEVDWERGDDEWRPVGLERRPQGWFDAAEDGETLLLREGLSERAALEPAANWLVHRSQARSGFLGETSLLLNCVRPFVVRHLGLKDWLSFAEVYGMPMLIGRLRQGVPWDSDEATSLISALRELGVDAKAVVREGDEIEPMDVQATGGGDVFERLYDLMGSELTLMILGQLATSSEGGGWSQDNAQEQVRDDLRDDDAKDLGQTLTDRLVEPISVFNMGEDVPPPVWRFDLEEREDLKAKAETWKTVGEAVPGLQVSEQSVYEEFDIPQPAEGEETIPLGDLPGGTMVNERLSHRGRDPADDGEAISTESKGLKGRVIANETLITDPLFVHEAHRRGTDPRSLHYWLNQDPAELQEDVFRTQDEEAIEWMEERRMADEEAWNALSPAGKQRAWWVSGLGQQPTAILANEMVGVLREGQTENEFLTRIEEMGLSVPHGQKAGPGQIHAWQARIVHRNNRWAAHNAGQYVRLQESITERPYGEWICHSPCPICEPLCGHKAPLNGSFFSTWWPQIHHQCQCEVVSVAERDLTDADRRAMDRADPQPNDADPSFTFHPGDAYYVEGRGMGPATQVGREDTSILSELSEPDTFL